MKENCEYLIDLCREVCLNLPKETKESISKEHCSSIMLISYFIIILFCTNNKRESFSLHYECTHLLCRPLYLFTPSLLRTLVYYNVTAHQLVNHFMTHRCTCTVYVCVVLVFCTHCECMYVRPPQAGRSKGGLVCRQGG